MENLKRVAIISLLIVSLLLSGFYPSVAEPVTITTVIVVTAAAITIVQGSIWIIDRLFGDEDPRKVCTTVTVTTTEAFGDGRPTKTTTKTMTKYSESPQTITVPSDFPGLIAPPGFNLSENILFDAQEDQQMKIEYQDVDYTANVLDPTDDTVSVSYDVERATTFRLSRPETAFPGEESTLNLPVTVDSILLSSLGFPETYGTLSWVWTIETAELGTIFESSVSVSQGGNPIIAGDIPEELFTLSPGQAQLSRYNDSLSVVIPADIDTLNFTMTFRTIGVDFETMFYDCFETGDTSGWSSTVP